MNTDFTLRSRGLVKPLRVLTVFIIICAGLVLLSHIFSWAFPGAGDQLAVSLLYSSILLFLASVAFQVVYLVWVYKYHKDLKFHFNNYPVTPGQALARRLIPLLNIWGIWNYHTQLTKRLREYPDLAGFARPINVLLILFYLFTFFSDIFIQGDFSAAFSYLKEASAAVQIGRVIGISANIALSLVAMRLVSLMNTLLIRRNAYKLEQVSQ